MIISIKIIPSCDCEFKSAVAAISDNYCHVLKLLDSLDF